ncbi:DoxX family protein [Flavivirga rizhaonensis]|nr:DoxX family protein [Flavivirga rizhaonensis]
MSTKTKNIIYFVTTGLLTLLVLATIGNSIFNPEFSKRFVEIGFPSYLIAPLMITKSLGLITIWLNTFLLLKEWGYSGFFFLFLLAFLAEINAPVPDYFSPVMALVLLSISYFFWQKKAVIKTK